jgi:hypothetical protein
MVCGAAGRKTFTAPVIVVQDVSRRTAHRAYSSFATATAYNAAGRRSPLVAVSCADRMLSDHWFAQELAPYLIGELSIGKTIESGASAALAL